MKLVEVQPKHSFVAQFIDKYQYYDIEHTTFLKSIPNGKIESWVIKNGSCQLWDERSNRFNENKQNGFYPASNAAAYFKIEGGFKCLNIKWNLFALALPFFRRFYDSWEDFSLEEFIGKDAFREISDFNPICTAGFDCSRLDQIFTKAIARDKIDANISNMIQAILTKFPYGFKVPELASHLCVSTKTLERQIKNHLALFPKELSSILRFSSTTNYHLNQSKPLFFTDSIKFGYYDQSHYIKECKKVTGYTPTEFFSKLKFSTNDLIIETDNLTLLK